MTLWPLRLMVKRALPRQAAWMRREYSRLQVCVPFGRPSTEPFRRNFGVGQGLPVDRYYIERFLAEHRGDIRGRVLEVADRRYTTMFGGARVTQSDVLHVEPDADGATLTADLSSADHLPSGTFDCIIVTQTLQFIFDTRAAIRTLHRLLKPEGTLLLTVPGISQISRYDADRWGDFWRFSPMSVDRLLRERFRPDDVTVCTYGNVLTATAFLHGLVLTELRPADLNACDRDYPLIVAARGGKAGGADADRPPGPPQPTPQR